MGLEHLLVGSKDHCSLYRHHFLRTPASYRKLDWLCGDIEDVAIIRRFLDAAIVDVKRREHEDH